MGWLRARSRRTGAAGAAVAVLGVAAPLALGACGGDDDSTVDTGPAPSESTTTAVTPTDPPPVATDLDPDPPAAEPVRVESADGSAVLMIPAGALPEGFDPGDVSVEWSAGEMYHEEIETFRSGFVEALRTGDVDWLVGRLHPDVLTLYGEAACREHLPTVVDIGADMIVDSVGEPGPWRWELDGASREYAAAVPLATTFTSRDQTIEQEVHVVSIGGRFHWWTDCGDPLPDGLTGGDRLGSETVAMVRLEPSGLTLTEPARLEWRLPRFEGMLLGFHVSGDIVETVDLDLVVDDGQETTAAATVDQFSDYQTFRIYGEELVVTSSNPAAVSRTVGEEFVIENSIRRRSVANRTAKVDLFFDTSGLGDVLLGTLDPDGLRSGRPVALDYVITPIDEDWTVSERQWNAPPVVEPGKYTNNTKATHGFEDPDVATSGRFTCVFGDDVGGVYYSATFTARVDAVPAPDLPAGVELPSFDKAEFTTHAEHRTEVECREAPPTWTTSPDGTVTTTTAATTTTSPDGTVTTTTTTVTTTTTIPPGTGAGTGVDHPPFEPGNGDTGGASAGIACGRIPGVGAGAIVTIEVEGGQSSGTHTGTTDADGAFQIPFAIEFYDVIRWRVIDVSAPDGAPIDTPQLESELDVGGDDVECVIDG